MSQFQYTDTSATTNTLVIENPCYSHVALTEENCFWEAGGCNEFGKKLVCGFFVVYFTKLGGGGEEELPGAVSAIPTCHRGQEFA